MKFSEMPYTRPDYAAAAKELDSLTARLRGAASAQEQVALYKEYETLLSHLSTQATLCSIRHTPWTPGTPSTRRKTTTTTSRPPLLEEKLQPFRQALLASPYRAELEESLGKLLFQNMELEEKAFSPEIVPLMQEENRLANEYQKLYASAQIPFMGKTVTVAQLGPYKESTDRATRRAALEAEGSFFDENREQFDELFDKLVKNRTQQAKALGFECFVELGAIRRMRNCYTPADVASLPGPGGAGFGAPDGENQGAPGQAPGDRLGELHLYGQRPELQGRLRHAPGHPGGNPGSGQEDVRGALPRDAGFHPPDV